MKRVMLMLAAAALIGGCQTADPASRSNRTAYRDIRVDVNGCSNTVNMTVGDGLYASADGGGDTQSNTPTQTTDTKPEVAVGVGGGSAGTGGASPQSGLTDKIVAALKSAGIIGDGETEAAAKAVSDACADGSCSDQPTTTSK